MFSQELLILIIVSVACLIVTLFLIKRLLKLVYYIIIALLSFLPGYYLGEHVAVYLGNTIRNDLLLDIASFAISFISVYIVLVFFINYFTRSRK